MGKEILENRINTVLHHYVMAALWSSTNPDNEEEEFLDENYSIDDIDEKLLESMKSDIKKFISENYDSIEESGMNDEQLGHDLWLTRNGHGAGFWDRGYEKEVSDKLSDAAREMKGIDLYVGDDGKIHALQVYSNGGDVGYVFRDDTNEWFDLVADNSKKFENNKEVLEAVEICNKEASRENLEKLRGVIKTISYTESVKKKIDNQINNILEGKYKKEFKFMFGGKRRGGGKTSTTSEFFSMFVQASTYDWENSKYSKGGGVNKIKKLKQSAIDKNIIDISKKRKSKYTWMAWDNIDYYNAGLKPNSIKDSEDKDDALDAAHGFVEDDFAFVTVVIDNRKGEIIGRTDGSDFGRNDDDDNDDEMSKGGGVGKGKIKFFEVADRIKRLQYDVDPTDLRLHSEESFRWGAKTEEDYKAAEKEIDSIKYKGKGWEIYGWYDVSGFDYWMKRMEETNYIQLTIAFDKDTVDESEVEKIDKALDSALADADAIQHKYDYDPHYDKDEEEMKRGGEFGNWEGTDVNLEISLEEYGFVARKTTKDYPDEYQVVYKLGDNSYGYSFVREKFLNDLINAEEWASEDDVKSFLNTVGMSKEEWLELSTVMKLSDVMSYWGHENILGTEYNPNDKKWAYEFTGIEDSGDYAKGGAIPESHKIALKKIESSSIIGADILDNFVYVKEKYPSTKHENVDELVKKRKKELEEQGYSVKTKKWNFEDLARGYSYSVTAVKEKKKNGGGIDNEIEHYRYLTIQKVKGGLQISLNEEGVELVKELKEEGQSDWDIWAELFENVQGNSEYIFHADMGDSEFGLTSAEGITDGFYYNGERGDMFKTDHPESAKVYWFPNYMIQSPLDIMIEKGSVVFDEAKSMAKGGGVDEKLYYVVAKKKGQLVDVSELPMTKEDAERWIKEQGIEKHYDYNTVDIIPYHGNKPRHILPKYSNGGGVNSDCGCVHSDVYNSIMDCLNKGNEVSVEAITLYLDRKPNYEEEIGGFTLVKCYLRPYFKIK